MADLSKLDRPLVEQWLREARVAFDECGECDGLHIRALRSIDGAIDSRLFLERYGLLLTTELEIRPMALLGVSADLGRLNMDFPTLKIFLDIVDDATPQLVIAGVLPASPGLALQQFAAFIAMTMEATRQVAADCLQLDYLFPTSDKGQGSPSSALH